MHNSKAEDIKTILGKGASLVETDNVQLASNIDSKGSAFFLEEHGSLPLRADTEYILFSQARECEICTDAQCRR